MKGFVGGYYSFAIWITRLAYLNILWILFTVLGLVVFGLAPATTAMFSITRKWVLGESEVPMFKTFWETYKKEFLRSNAIGIILFVVIYLLSIEFQILRSVEGASYFIASYAVLAMLLILSILILYLFPIFVHFKLRFIDYFKWPLIIGILHPILTVFLLVVVGGLNLLTIIFLPGLIFFLNASITAYIVTWGVAKTFDKYEDTPENEALVTEQ